MKWGTGVNLAGIYTNEYGKGLSINITDADNSLDLDLAREVAGYFRLTDKKAVQIVQEVSIVIKDWKKVATTFKISNAEQERMAPAFI